MLAFYNYTYDLTSEALQGYIRTNIYICTNIYIYILAVLVGEGWESSTY